MMVQHAHSQGLWIRFYTLGGAIPEQQKENGWFKIYNFPSLTAAQVRWRTALDVGVDYLAADQYELAGRITNIRRNSAETMPSKGPSTEALSTRQTY